MALPRGTVVSPILTIDSDRVFLESDFGQRVIQDIEAKSEQLTAENRRIELALEAEERDITEKRANLPADEFRTLANAFDEKVQQIRRDQAEKGEALNDTLDQEREVFLNAAAPVLGQLMRDAGAVVILERRSVIVSATAVDITDNAIALLNQTLGSGEARD